MVQIKKLMNLWLNKSRKSSDVKKITQDHIQELEKKLEETQQMLKALKSMSSCCHGDQRAECPILENLSQS
jgi:DNA-binding transcriptional MerR regulator